MTSSSILFIDAYDSFSNNITTLLRKELSVSVSTIRIDDPRFVLNDDAFYEHLRGFDAVVAGPGPGHPANPSDVGLIAKLWKLPEDYLLPVLGICLGFQSLALDSGATVERLQEPRHGLVTAISHCGRDIFEASGNILATQYHSLHAVLCIDMCKVKASDFWKPTWNCRELVPLAWDVSDEANGPVLMAARHCHKPFWGIQYHPESVCSNEEGRQIIRNWWHKICVWRSRQSRKDRLPGSDSKAIRSQADVSGQAGIDAAPRPRIQWRVMQLPQNVDVTHVHSSLRLGYDKCEPILLESGGRNGKLVNTETGRFSIIGLHDSQSMHIRYSVSSRRLRVIDRSEVLINRSATIADVFAFIERFMQEHPGVGGPENVPFWGGLIGFISYEAGLESIDVEPPKSKEGHSDSWFVHVQRSVVIDHVGSRIFVQSLLDGDEEWLDSVEQRLRGCKATEPVSSDPASETLVSTFTSSPDGDQYRQKVRSCQDHLRAGLSYELCLTDRTTVATEHNPWSLYLRLRNRNPAPFGAYLQLSSPDKASPRMTLLSSSPERFLSWSRDGNCQFRPIKGTVQKTPVMTRARAERILSSPKEQAENLMIVDLIRHDLNGVTSARNVVVPKLMSVEEYETVFQLVSVIEGGLEGSGVPVLAASLPPGSMTGAPKKRSCELLKGLEGEKARGLYSGVMGYFDVGGGGDFCVVIRSAFKWGDEEWHIGAGGAVTALSNPEAEWQEMLAKRENVLRAFC